MAFQLKMNLEKYTLSRFQKKKPPGAIPSSTLGLEIFTGILDDFGFEDYLRIFDGSIWKGEGFVVRKEKAERESWNDGRQ